MQTRESLLKECARSLRTWAGLRAHRFAGAKFTRQVVVGDYIGDFAARLQKLAIEIDGDTHGRQTGYDAARTNYLNERGYRVLRFTNSDVMANVEGVLTAIGMALRDSLLAFGDSPLPGPFPDGERGS